tara:strand:- start:105802 stop:106056 length:255 start_codon:yes stop_codon:yes gene_type:complete
MNIDSLISHLSTIFLIAAVLIFVVGAFIIYEVKQEPIKKQAKEGGAMLVSKVKTVLEYAKLTALCLLMYTVPVAVSIICLYFKP